MVARALPRPRIAALAAGTALYRVYSAAWGDGEHNRGYGDARFTPIDDPATGARLAGMYLAATPAAALPETVFRDVHHGVCPCAQRPTAPKTRAAATGSKHGSAAGAPPVHHGHIRRWRCRAGQRAGLQLHDRPLRQ